MASARVPYWWNSPRTLLRTVLQLDDTHHSIALGSAIGMWIGLTPTVGFQMLLVVFVSVLTAPFFRFNRIAAIVAVYVSNPITMVPLYYFLYKVGAWFVGGDVTRDDFAAMVEYKDFAGWWQTVVSLVIDLGYPLLVGTLIVATVGGVLTYPAMRWLLHRVRPEDAPVPEGSQRRETAGAAK